jgi:hypothetical protein
VALAWNWLSAPYLVCALSLAAVGLAAAFIRGDRVLRLGTIGAAITALPWAACSALAACTWDPALAARLLRLGNGPLALVGPCLLLVLLGVTGQLERHRWIARAGGVVGVLLMIACWATPWVVAGARELPSGVFYISPGPLAGVHFAQLAIWLAVGIAIARRSISGGERRNLVRMIVALFVLIVVGSSDLLLLYGIAGAYPIAWLSATVAALVTLYYEVRSDLLRPQGVERGVVLEIAVLALVIAAIAVAVAVTGARAPVAIAAGASLVWVAALGVVWARRHARPVRVARERALEQFVVSLGELDAEPRIVERLTRLWQEIEVEVGALLRADGERLVDVVTGAARELDRDVAAWLAAHGELLAAGDLGTMRLGELRPRLEALAAGDTALVVPLMDRGALVGLVLAHHRGALREEERGLVIESARAAARALTYAALARAAARERETAREVEVAEAMRLQAAARRDDELGPWAVAAEYRTAPRTTGAGWSANLLADGRLAVLVTEAQAHGVAAALATAALTGAFAAATSGSAPVDLDGLLTSMRASSEGVVRGGEPVAAFLAIVDADAHTIAWACAGHPGAAVVAARDRAPVMLGGGGARLEASLTIATRGEAAFPDDALLVIASTAVRGDDEARWQQQLRELAPAGPRVAAMLVDAAARAGGVYEDLLAVVARRRPERRGEASIPRPEAPGRPAAG